MTHLIEQNYQSIIDRGLINETTTHGEFISKVKEEVSELEQAYLNNDFENLKEEIADVILTCLNYSKHFEIDIETELKTKIKINQQRAKL